MEVILHIGTDKTGSTSIQRHLSINEKWFQSHSVYIPKTGFGAFNGHAALLSALDSEDLKNLASELEQAELAGYKHALISWEGMNFYNPIQIALLYKAINPRPVSIVVYLREQAEIIQTGVLQQLKSNKNNRRLHVFDRAEVNDESYADNSTFYNKNRDYYTRLKRWQRVIPKAKFMVGVFSRQTLVDGDVVSDFIDRIGLSIDSEFQRHEGEINQSLDVESALLVENWQAEELPVETIIRLTDIARAVIRADGGGSKYFLNEKSVASLRKAYARSNKKLARKFLKGRNYPFFIFGECWRDESFSEVQQRSQLLLEKIEKIDTTPTWKGAVTADRVSNDLSLDEGWCDQEKWGIWSKGEHSGIRFRLLHRSLAYDVTAVRVVIHGSYHGENESTVVSINGIDFGEQKLVPGHPGLELSLKDLLPYETVDVVLRHRAPQGRRGIAFGLRKVGRRLVRSDSMQ